MTTPTDIVTRIVHFVVAMAVTGAVINLAGVVAIPEESQAVRAHPAGTLGALLTDEQQHVKERYQLYGLLRDVAVGGTIVVPRDVLDSRTLQYISGIDVERAADRRRVPEGTLRRLPDAIRHTGMTEPTVGSAELYPYVVATSLDSPKELVTYVTRRSNTIVIVDAATARDMELP